jgi:hypothetical protein
MGRLAKKLKNRLFSQSSGWRRGFFQQHHIPGTAAACLQIQASHHLFHMLSLLICKFIWKWLLFSKRISPGNQLYQRAQTAGLPLLGQLTARQKQAKGPQ